MKNGIYFSNKLHKKVYVTRDESEMMVGCTCTLCGKEMKGAYMVVDAEDDDACEEYYGSECIKSLALKKLA